MAGVNYSRGEDSPRATGTCVCRKDILFYRMCPYGCGYYKVEYSV